MPLDLTATADRVLGRVAHLPIAGDATITLLHVVHGSLSAQDRRVAEADANKLLDEQARILARACSPGVTIERVVVHGSGVAQIVACADSIAADLIAMGRGDGRLLRDIFLGSTAERVLRGTYIPVLVVRRPAVEPYRTPALALDFDAAAVPATAAVVRAAPSAPRIHVIHAFESTLPVYPSLSEAALEEYRGHYREKARGELEKVLASTRLPATQLHLEHGSARGLIETVIGKAGIDLLVIGTRAHSGLTHVFVGSVAGDVLRIATCDVLVVPPRPS